MTTYTFKPKSSTQSVSWSDSTVWTDGVVPNSVDADVVFPTVTTSNGLVYFSTIDLSSPPSYVVNSISVSNNSLHISGNLGVTNGLDLLSGGHLDMSGGSLSAGSLTNGSVIGGSGQISVTGTMTNAGFISGNGLTITAQHLNNTGSLEAVSGGLTVNVGSGGFDNLSGSTLSGGTYTAIGSTLDLNVGGVIANDAANIALNAGEIASFDNGSSAYVPIESSLQSIAPSGSLSLFNATYNWRSLVDDGALVLGSAAFPLQNSATLNTPQLDVGSAGHVTLFDESTLSAALLNVANHGQISGDGTINAAIANSGEIIAGQLTSAQSTNKLVINGNIAGNGVLEIAAAIVEPFELHGRKTGATLELNGDVSQKVIFADDLGTLVLDDPAHFFGSIATHPGDRVILPSVSLSSITSYSYAGDVHGGILTLQQASAHIDIALDGSFDVHSFVLSSAPPGIPSSPLVISGFNHHAFTVQWAGSPDLGVRSPPYQVAGIGDFNNDGTSDVLWRDPTTGNLDEWHIVNGQWAGSTPLGSHGTDWQVAGIGDLDGDGTGNVLWRNANTGQMDEWRMANGNWAGTVPLGSHGADWQVAGLGDFNGDGTADILWRNPGTGQMDEWQMSNGNWAQSLLFGSHGTDWIVAGIGDFNGDGNSDVLWRNPTTGQMDEWKLVNGQWAGSVDLGFFNTAYQVAAVGDFNGDGTADVLWRNPSTGQVEGWMMADGQWGGSFSLGSFDPAYHVAGSGDFNHNGTADILWRNEATGQTSEWLLAPS